jgi:hypothetical protein
MSFLRPIYNLTATLPPEQQRAVELMYSRLSNYPQHTKSSYTLDEICTSGNMFFTFLSLTTSDLPKGTYWQWNQSRSKRVLEDPGYIRISLCKLNTRKHRGIAGCSPSVKLWVMHVELIQQQFSINFLWCEKGDVPEVVANSNWRNSGTFSLPLEIQEVTLEDLAFLREFTDWNTAQTLGWGQVEQIQC